MHHKLHSTYTEYDANKVQEHNMDPNIFKGHTHCAFENKDNFYRIY